MEELTQAVFNLLEDLRTKGPSEADVNKAKEQARLAHQKAVEDNSVWLTQLQDRLTTPSDDGGDILR